MTNYSLKKCFKQDRDDVGLENSEQYCHRIIPTSPPTLHFINYCFKPQQTVHWLQQDLITLVV